MNPIKDFFIISEKTPYKQFLHKILNLNVQNQNFYRHFMKKKLNKFKMSKISSKKFKIVCNKFNEKVK